MATFVCVKDRFGDVHADSLEGEANSAAIRNEAKDICQRFGIDDSSVSYGVTEARDAGAARLMGDAITWLDSFDASKL